MSVEGGSQPGAVERQIVLPLGKAIEISVKSFKIRMGRSLITMGGIILAIAFLMSILTSQALTRAASREEAAVLTDREKEELKEEEARRKWLVGLSLLVCGVGITNAMLMSVTERYKEIGTMKCLGALDRFVVKLFLLESGFLGVIGSVAGIILGGGISFLGAWVRGDLGAGFPAREILFYALASGFAGVLLAVLGAIYPAYRAAQMVPAEAMRVEA